MNHRKTFLCAALCLLTVCSGTACGASQNISESVPDSTAQTTAETGSAETEPAESAEEKSAETEKPEPVYDYIHGEEGYFSLPASGLGTPVKLQTAGTCWVVSASTAMESGALVRHGKTIAVDALDLLGAVYYHKDQNGDRTAEGWHLAENLTAEDFGGWGWMVTEAAADGIGDILLTETNDFENASREQLQQMIRTNGAVSISVPDRQSAKGYFGDYQTVNDPDAKPEHYDHVVTIVGWDDHFPKSYFRNAASQDGAWLIQNSLSEKYAYYWLSYDTEFLSPYSFDISEDYGEVVSYDGGKENHIGTGDETAVANVFHHPGKLTAVGTYTITDGQKFTIEIRDAAMENVLYTQDAEYAVKGYHLTDLEIPQDVSDYSVVLRFAGDAPVEGEGFSNEFLSYQAGAEAGQSFVLLDGKWADLSLKETADALKLDFAPNNACIKAVYAK